MNLFALIALAIALVAPLERNQASSTHGPTDQVLCDGPRDLIVDSGYMTLGHSATYDRVCVAKGSTLRITADVTLTIGDLYIAKGGAMSADGEDGGEPCSSDGDSAGVAHPDGAHGWTLILNVHMAVIHGTLSTNGGQGMYEGGCDGATDIGAGGDGGQLYLRASQLDLDGTLSAVGGSGGRLSDACDPSFKDDPLNAPRGGNGGNIQVHTAAGATDLRARVNGGKMGQGCYGKPSKDGANGSLTVGLLSSSERSALPSPPPSVVHYLALRPTVSTRQPSNYSCDRGDLDVGRGAVVRLSGTLRYRRVCVDNGGTIVAAGNLTLTAVAITVKQGGTTTANGGHLRRSSGVSGQYGALGACTLDHRPIHAGVAGTGYSGAGYTDPEQVNPIRQTTYAGAGGDAVRLIAPYIAIDGSVSASGGVGGNEYDFSYYGSYATGPVVVPSAGGGSGGGIEIVGRSVSLGGVINVLGGRGGTDGGRHGSVGCIKVFAYTLTNRPAAASLLGPTVIGRRTSADPALS